MSEIYKGVKFYYKNIGKTVTKYPLLPELKKYCDFFYRKNLAPPYPGGSSGNLSFRIKENEINFIITASRTALRNDMQDSDFSEVVGFDNVNNIVVGKGSKIPSSESVMHFLIYQKRNDINAVFHGHSPDILNLAKKINIPVTKKEEEYGTLSLADNVVNLIENNDFIIIRNHGFVSVGKNMNEAYQNIVDLLNYFK